MLLSIIVQSTEYSDLVLPYYRIDRRIGVDQVPEALIPPLFAIVPVNASIILLYLVSQFFALHRYCFSNN